MDRPGAGVSDRSLVDSRGLRRIDNYAEGRHPTEPNGPGLTPDPGLAVPEPSTTTNPSMVPNTPARQTAADPNSGVLVCLR